MQSVEERKSRWSLSRIEIRTAIVGRQWPVARVELEHEERGRLTDIAAGKGPMDCVFTALGQLFGIEARVEALSLDYRAAGEGTPARVAVSLEVAAGGGRHPGRAEADDILHACAAAYVDALARIEGAEPARTIWS